MDVASGKAYTQSKVRIIGEQNEIAYWHVHFYLSSHGKPVDQKLEPLTRDKRQPSHPCIARPAGRKKQTCVQLA